VSKFHLERQGDPKEYGKQKYASKVRLVS